MKHFLLLFALSVCAVASLRAQNYQQMIKLIMSDRNTQPLYLDRSVNDNFGYSVAVDGNTAVVGVLAQDYDTSRGASLTNAGAAFVFVRSGNNWQFQQKLVARDRAPNDNFGVSVSVSGETIVVGAYLEDEDASTTPGATLSGAGSAYVFTRTGTTWTQQQKLVAADRALNDNFGISVSVSGETVVVGASQEDEDASPTPGNTVANAGSAYVFTRTGTAWTQQQKLVGSDRTQSDYFGFSVAISGSTIVAGAYLNNEDGLATPGNALSDAGAAFVFTRQGTVWTQQQKLVATDRALGDEFGWSVAISGETIVVGAYLEDEDASPTPGAPLSSAGSAYVFARTGTVWTQQQKLVANDRGANDYFGYAVSINGNTIAIGAYQEDEDAAIVPGNTLSNAGSAYIFIRTGTLWTQQQKLVAADRGSGDNAGLSVAVSGETVLTGAPYEDEDGLPAPGNTISNAGAAYVFVRTGVVWAQQQKLTGASNIRLSGQQFGYSVAIDGNTAVIGAPYDDFDGAGGGSQVEDAGAAYVFVRNGGSWQFQQKLVPADRASNDYFGFAVSVSSNTVVVGAYFEDENAAATPGVPLNDAGSAYVFTRTGTTWTQQQKLVAADREANDNFGYSVSISGNTLVVGANLEDNDVSGGAFLNDAGSAYVFVRTGTTWTQQQKLVAADRGANDFFARSVSISGETIVIGSYLEDQDASPTPGATLTDAGSVYVFVRSGTTWTQQQKLVAADRGTGDNFGCAVAISGNTLVAGAFYEDQDASPTPGAALNDAGSAYVFTRTGNLWTQQQKLVAADRGANDYFGFAVAISGDTLVAGAYPEDQNAAAPPGATLDAAGSAYVFIRNGGTWSQAQKLVAADRGAGDNLGWSVAVSGATVLLGAKTEDEDAAGANYLMDAGSAYVFEEQSAILAARFLSVSGERGAGGQAVVKFTTQEDGSVRTFHVERSTDGNRFETVAILNGSDRAGQFSYVAEDAGINSTVVYYRIKANNANGSMDHSTIIKLSNHHNLPDGSQVTKLTLSPNPVKDVVTLKMDGLKGKATVRFTDVSGRIVLSQPLAITPSGMQQLNVAGLSPGIYQVVVVSEAGKVVWTQKLIRL